MNMATQPTKGESPATANVKPAQPAAAEARPAPTPGAEVTSPRTSAAGGRRPQGAPRPETRPETRAAQSEVQSESQVEVQAEGRAKVLTDEVRAGTPAAARPPKPAPEARRRPAPEASVQSGTQSDAPSSAQSGARLGEADIAVLREGLGTGMTGYARQGDVIELHKRISDRFDKLPAALAEQAAGTPDSTAEQMQAIEGALNSLEGALRIELAPFLTKAVREEISRTEKPRSLMRTTGLVVLALGAGIAVGTLWNGEILALVQQLRAATGF